MKIFGEEQKRKREEKNDELSETQYIESQIDDSQVVEVPLAPQEPIEIQDTQDFQVLETEPDSMDVNQPIPFSQSILQRPPPTYSQCFVVTQQNGKRSLRRV